MAIDVFTTSDVASICRVSTRIVTKWFDEDMLEGYRLAGSKHRRFTKENVEKFLKTHNMPLEWLDEEIEKKRNKRTKKVDTNKIVIAS